MHNTFIYRDGHLQCDGVSLAKIARAVGTPAWVYSQARIEANYHAVVEAFAPLGAELHFSLKSNANLRVLRLLAKLGAGADVVSGGEIFKALRAGFAPEEIVFAGVGKTRAELIYALQQGIGWFNVESVQELELLNRLSIAEGVMLPRVALRLNPNVYAETHAHMATGHVTAKFGIDFPTAARIAQVWHTRFPNLRLAGVHIHIGSQLATPVPTVTAVQRTLAFIDDISAVHQIEAINIGGGLPIAYRDDERPATVEAFAAALIPRLADSGLRLMMEPGRRIVGDAGVLLMEVQYVKARAGMCFVITDGGMDDLLRTVLYGVSHRVWPLVQREAPTAPTQIAGPICESADFLARDVALPPLAPGDLLAVMDTGAYGAAMSTTYNARPLAPEVMVADGGFEVVRRRQTWEDLVSLEVLDCPA